jgi:CubicO group peptidase (beta-lactamase class C family)
MDLATFFQQMGQAQLWSAPGAVFNYSNVGFELAGLAMQKAAKQEFGALIESKVFAPAGMVDARMDAAKVVSEGNFATSYASTGAFGPSDMVGATVMGPDTGAWASASDLGHFAQALLDEGGTMLKPASVTKMTTSRTQTDDPTQQYGIGMFLLDLGGTPVWTHSGENGGYVTDLTLLPTRGFASAILVSSESGPPDSYFKAVETFTRSPLPAPADSSFKDADEPDHVGTYQSATAGTVTVAKSGAAMTITVAGQTATLTPVFKDSYTFPYAPWGGGDLPVNFARSSGKVSHVVSRAFVAARM